MHQSLNTRLELDECSVVGQAHDTTSNAGTDRVLAGHAGPGIGALLFQAERNAPGLSIVFEDADFHLVADVEHFRRMADTAPGHVRDVEQPVDAAEVDECSVIRDVLYHAMNQLPFLQRGQRCLPFRIPRLFQEHTPGYDDVATPMIDLDNLERERAPDQAVK